MSDTYSSPIPLPFPPRSREAAVFDHGKSIAAAPLSRSLGLLRMQPLANNLHERIQALCAEGDHLAEIADYSTALSKYWAAWELLPDPKTDYEAATWILAAIGDANFLSGDFESGRDNLSKAMHCPDAIGNPFLHLRLGQCQFELGNLGRAADELARAYMGAGPEVFEDADRYFAFLKTRLQPPPGGWEA